MQDLTTIQRLNAEAIEKHRTPQGPPAAGQYGWIDFSHMENDPDPERFYIEIYSTDDEGHYDDEVAVIVHRTDGGVYPLNGEVAKEKRETAQKIVDALNAQL